MDFGDRQLGRKRTMLWAMMFQRASRRKHGRRRRIARCCACPRTISFNDHADDMEPAPLLVEGNPARKASAMMAKNKKKTKTSSSSDWGKNPIIIIHKTPNNAMISPKAAKPTQELSTINKQLSRAISTPQQIKDCLDVLDLFMVNRNQFLDILNYDEDVPRHQSAVLVRQNSNRNLGLRKSGSFPSVNSKSPRFLRPSVLEDKHMEVWSSNKTSASSTSLAIVKKSDSGSISISQKVRCFLGGFIRKRILKKGRHSKKNMKRANLVRVKGDEIVPVKRSLSLTESLSRYAPLIEQSSSVDAKWTYRKSKSLRLSEEDKSGQGNGNRMKYSYRRRLSMTDLDSIYQAKEPIGRLNWLESDGRKSDCVEEIEEPSGNPNLENMDCEIENQVAEEQDVASEIPLVIKTLQVESVSNDAPNSLQRDTTKVDSLRFQFESINDADFNYVKDILDLSGFLDQDCASILWHSLDEPLSPLVYKEMESLLKYEEGGNADDDNNNNNSSRSIHRRLLFDMVNEELLGIFESSLTYFPKPLLHSSQCRPMPKGKRVLEQVWKRISERMVPDTKEISLFDIFWKEMNRGDGWMNIQFDCEDVALELEDMIMDQLVEEILCVEF
ncbi:Protein TRM32 [Linum grandiflorum]